MHTLTILGKRWFQKTYGNTYHSAQILIDGEPIATTGKHYGYGDRYLQTAFELLEAQGLIQPPRIHYGHNNAIEAPWIWAERVGVKLYYSAADVGREKDL